LSTHLTSLTNTDTQIMDSLFSDNECWWTINLRISRLRTVLPSGGLVE